jgi:thiamine-monophosphate kinase
MTTSPEQTVAGLGEQALIERIRARVPAAPAWVAIGVGDDAAVVEPARNRAEVITTDALVEGVHFDLAYVPPSAVGHKALAVNLSDLAAMGAEPRAALLSLMLPDTMRVAAFDELVDGWFALARRYAVVLVGGNISRSPGPLVVDVTAIGSVKPRRVLARGGARPGDGIYVSGSVGAAFAGRLACRAAAGGHRAPAAAGEDPGGIAACEARFLRPEPRVRLGVLLGRNLAASACVDLSDGLGDGVQQLAAASGVGAEIDGDAIPVPEAARRWFQDREGLDALDAAVSGGDDYELLFTVTARRRRALASVLSLAGGLPCTRIGTITADRRLTVTRGGVKAPLPGGFAHFR